MSLVHSFMVGRWRCHTLEAGWQRLDGGAMFGVVPKPLWAQRIAPDDRNRIPLTMRCLLIEHAEGLVLVDTGDRERVPDHGFRWCPVVFWASSVIRNPAGDTTKTAGTPYREER